VARSLGMTLLRTVEYGPGRIRGWWEIGRDAFSAQPGQALRPA
jgi:hypothetical protein